MLCISVKKMFNLVESLSPPFTTLPSYLYYLKYDMLQGQQLLASQLCNEGNQFHKINKAKTG